MIPPSDPTAEAAVLSALMLKPGLFDELRDELDAADFFLMNHRWLFEAITALDAAGEQIDIVTVGHRLQSTGRLKDMGGPAFLVTITDATPSVANVAAHARIIRQFSALRRMSSTLQTLASISQAPETRVDVDGFLERCETEVFGAHVTAVRDTSSSLREVMATATASLSTETGGGARGVSTGMSALDELTLGLVPGELWYVAARPGMGKTALALGISASVAANGGHAACFSMEMKRPELAERLISSDSGVPLKALQKRELSGDQWSRVTQTVQRLSHLPLMLDDASTLTPSRLRSRVRRHASTLRAQHPEGKLALVVVDYVQLMAWDKPTGNRNDELERISRALKILAGEFGVTVLALAQLPRWPRSAWRPVEPRLEGSRGQAPGSARPPGFGRARAGRRQGAARAPRRAGRARRRGSDSCQRAQCRPRCHCRSLGALVCALLREPDRAGIPPQPPGRRLRSHPLRLNAATPSRRPAWRSLGSRPCPVCSVRALLRATSAAQRYGSDPIHVQACARAGSMDQVRCARDCFRVPCSLPNPTEAHVADDDRTGMVQVELTEEQIKQRSAKLASEELARGELLKKKSTHNNKWNEELKQINASISVLAAEVDSHLAWVPAQETMFEGQGASNDDDEAAEEAPPERRRRGRRAAANAATA